MTPANPVGFQDAPHLASGNLNLVLSGSVDEGVQAPLSRLVGVGGSELAVCSADGTTGRRSAYQGDDRAALGFGETTFASFARAITETVNPLSIEAENALTDSLRVAAQLSGIGDGTKSIPAAGDHTSAEVPIGGSMAAGGKFAQVMFFGEVQRWTGDKQLWHDDLHG